MEDEERYENDPIFLVDTREPEEESWPKKPTKKVTVTKRKVGGVAPGRVFPTKIRAEAEPEKMVKKILNQHVEGITVKEVLGLSPDLMKIMWGMKRMPPIKTDAQVPATTLEADVNRIERIDAEENLYACASPTVLGRLEGTYRIRMLIDSGSEMCVMSKTLWKRLENELPIDRYAAWMIGSANATKDRVFGLCHSVSIDVGGVEVDVPVFVMEGAAQDMILGRTWERKTRAQYDNRADGSLHITISTPDDERMVTFCGVGKTDQRNRNRARLLQKVSTEKDTTAKGKSKETENGTGLSTSGESAGSRTI